MMDCDCCQNVEVTVTMKFVRFDTICPVSVPPMVCDLVQPLVPTGYSHTTPCYESCEGKLEFLSQPIYAWHTH